MDLKGKVAVVTGASSGIGRAAAVELARRGAVVSLVARRERELEVAAEQCRVYKVETLVLPGDVSVESDCRRIIQTTTERFGRVDVLVNNAGFGLFDDWATSSAEDLRAMFETNFFGAVNCTMAVLPQMLERRSGAIVNVSSIAGIMSFPRMGGYCASKFALMGFSESLRDEVMGRGITVSAICPSTTRTEFFDTAHPGKMPGASRLALAMSPEKVARAICRAAERGHYRTIMPLVGTALIRFKELAPRSAHAMIRKVSSLMEPSD
ncbi:MAG TPA: SDR family oxidoreductase [Thermoanaerobaculia bacterium]|nr:SDR family oxidoreductase [Thermoanaerobaculia bacterium]